MDSLIQFALDGKWKLAILSDDEICKGKKIPRTYTEVEACGAIDAIVPGNFDLELIRAGICKDPYFGKNILDMYQMEDRHAIYARTFRYEPVKNTTPMLIFEGLDTVADIYLNGELLAQVQNMYLIHCIDVPRIQNGENELVIHFSPACLVARKMEFSAGNIASRYNYEGLQLRKAPHTFGWDIMPRLVSAGIYRSVGIYNRPKETFKQIYLMTLEADADRNTAELELFFDVDVGNHYIGDYQIEVNGVGPHSSFFHSDRLWFTAGKTKFSVKNIELWWPKGSGAPNLYDVTIRLLCKGVPVATQHIRTGIRTARLCRTSTSTDLNFGDFHFEVNGRRIFVMGTCWVPLDAYHSRDKERLPSALELLDDVGCNMVRCWGGNVYECPEFYNACDEMGVMVWQDFAMACASYPLTPEFQEKIRTETVQIVRMLRQHPSLVLWCGDNECDMFVQFKGADRNPNGNQITRIVLPEVLYSEDPVRSFLPSSPYYDESSAKLPDRYLTENHLWGPRDYYKSRFYKDSLCSFASEIGYHGCPAEQSLRKFLSPECLWPWHDNEEWNLHASSVETDKGAPYVYRIELMAKQIRELFGAVPDNLTDFIVASQISQAEGNKFFIELFRYEQPRRSGLTWWNLIDGWPQFSDAVVDYYYKKKLSYYYIKNLQKPLLLTFCEPHDWMLPLVAVNNAGYSLSFQYTVKDFDTRVVLLSGKGICEDQQPWELATLPYSQSEKKLYLIEWECEGEKSKNHYLAGNPSFDLAWYCKFLKEFYPEYDCF